MTGKEEINLKKGRLNVMLIDDNLMILEMMATFLRTMGYGYGRFQDPRRAVKAFDPNKYQLVITDYSMPVMNGIEVLQNIRGRYPDTAVFIFSGMIDEEKEWLAKKSGALEVLRKPLDFKRLINLLTGLEWRFTGRNLTDRPYPCRSQQT